MAYEKQEWKTGDVITESKLNHIEDGIANGGGVISSYLSEDDILDKTWNEINTALRNGQLVILHEDFVDNKAFCSLVVETSVEVLDSDGSDIYVVVALTSTGQTIAPLVLTTNDPDGYPIVHTTKS